MYFCNLVFFFYTYIYFLYHFYVLCSVHNPWYCIFVHLYICLVVRFDSFFQLLHMCYVNVVE